MADERQEFSFTAGNFGSVSTEDLIEAGENFLSSNPEDITPVKPSKAEKKEEEVKKPEGKTKPEVKEVIIPKNEVDEEDIYSAMEGKINGDTEEEEETPGKVEKKVEGQVSADGNQEELNVFTSIAKELVTQGIFTPDIDEEGNEI